MERAANLSSQRVRDTYIDQSLVEVPNKKRDAHTSQNKLFSLCRIWLYWGIITFF